MEYHCDMRVTLDHLRRYAVSRSLFKPTTLGRAIGKLGFVQADPIRAPARAQDLTLRHRVADYRAGDLERRYPRLPAGSGAYLFTAKSTSASMRELAVPASTVVSSVPAAVSRAA